MAAVSKGGFLPGTVVGITLTAVLFAPSLPELPGLSTGSGGAALTWLEQNLGASAWLFAAVACLFVIDLSQLHNRLTGRGAAPDLRAVVGLDQRLDVWAQLFIGIGVVWTAIGMRDALQAAIGEGSLTGSASAVLENLVDGGILLALTTTIVGGVGGYLMRLAKTITVGSSLQAFYEALDRAGVDALLEATERIETHLQALSRPTPEATES